MSDAGFDLVGNRERIIGVVVPTCDRPAVLARALGSILAQTRSPDEVIVVDNGREALSHSALPGEVVLVRAPVRCGASQARNIGVAVSHADLVAFLDDDDMWDVEYLRHIELAARASHQLTYFVGSLCDLNSGVPVAGKNGPFEQSATELLRRNPGFVGSNVVVPRSHFLGIGGFDCRLRASEDVDLAIRASDAGARLLRVDRAVALFDSSHTDDRLSRIGNVLPHKWMFIRKHVRNPLRQVAFMADYSARVIVNSARRLGPAA